MYRFFRRFERLAFGIVTASAIVCTGFLVIHRFGGASLPDFVTQQATDAGIPFALVCEEATQVGSCDQLLTEWKGAK